MAQHKFELILYLVTQTRELMSLFLDSFSNLPVGRTEKVDLDGVATFKKEIEKYFFAEAIVRKNNSESSKTELILELRCNFSLADAISFFKKELFTEPKSGIADLPRFISHLQKKNKSPIDISEFSMIMTDTTFVVQKIYKKSILEHWNNILHQLIDQYDTMVNSLNEIPYEIFVPVFNENRLRTNTKSSFNKYALVSAKDYFNYWGLYFESEPDGIVYDVRTSSLVFNELYILNR